MIKKLFSWFNAEGAKDVNVELFYRSREVWSYTHIDSRTRHISVRAVLVYRKASDGMFWGLPLTKAHLHGKVIYVPREWNKKKVSALSQMRTLKASRLVQKLGVAGEREFAVLHNSIVRLLADTAPTPTRKPRVYVRPRRVEPAIPSPLYVLQPARV